MKRVLYLTNIQVPYRVKFFNALARHCDLTVFYQSKGCKSRDKAWVNREMPNFRCCYPRDLPWLVSQQYDEIIFGCYTAPIQICWMLVLGLRGIPYTINLDGAGYFGGRDWKSRVKRRLLSTAGSYMVAGEQGANSLKSLAGDKPIGIYRFSSLTKEEENSHQAPARREDSVLVVGQYFPYKGLDVALQAAAMDARRNYIFVGMGCRTGKFLRENQIPGNVEVIPFLPQQDLEKLYQRCGLLVLPSRQECWGLVVNEAASFGMPVVSTWGSGAAVEFSGETYPEFLAKPGDGEDLHRCILRFFSWENKKEYGDFLKRKSENYHIEENVRAHLTFFERHPKVSVIVPIYNGAPYLGRCLRSLVRQTYPNLQILLVDDGSTDGSYDICQAFARRDSRIRLCTQENAGVSAARNRGLALAEGEYVLFLDADDELPKGAVENLVKAMEPECDLVIGSHIQFRGPFRKTIQPCPRNFAQNQYPEDFEALDALLDTVWGKLYRRQVILDNQRTFDETLPYCEDHVFNLEFCRHARNIRVITPVCYRYRLGGAASSLTYHENFSQCGETLLQAYDRFFAGNMPETLRKRKQKNHQESVLLHQQIHRAKIRELGNLGWKKRLSIALKKTKIALWRRFHKRI